jgi:RNA polymerase sigma factor (sigma-70 family)
MEPVAAGALPNGARSVFLSHNLAEKPWVRRVVEQWRALGLPVFFDEDSILPGEVVIRAIERGITGSDHVVLVLSRASLASPWVAMELAMTLTSDPSGNHRTLIPVLIEPVELESIPLAIRSRNIVDLTQPEHRTKQYHLLLQSLGVVAPHLPEVPAFNVGTGGTGTTYALPGAGDREWQTSEKLLREHRGWIERVVAVICSKHGLWGADATDFAGWLQHRLAKDDYGVLQDLPGDINVKSYLALVVRRQFQEYRRRRWGDWRISRAAQRLGPPAPELEALVHRDGHPLDQAGGILRTAGRTTLSDVELARLLKQLPTQARHDRGIIALERALSQLGDEDRLIVRMRLQERRTLAFVARALKLKKKPLRHRVKRLRARLQELLEQEGVPSAEIAVLLGEQDGG